MDGAHIVSCSAEHLLIVWEMRTGKKIHSLLIASSPNDMAISPDGHFAYLSLYTTDQHQPVKIVQVMDLTSSKEKYAINSSLAGEEADAVAVSNDGRWLFVAREGPRAGLIIYNAQTGRHIGMMPCRKNGASLICRR